MTILSTENRYFVPIYCVFSKDFALNVENNVTLCLNQFEKVDFNMNVGIFKSPLALLGDIDPLELGFLDNMTLEEIKYYPILT